MLELARGPEPHAFAREQSAWVSRALLAALVGYAVVAPSMAWTKADDLLYILGIAAALSLLASYAVASKTAGLHAWFSLFSVVALASAVYVFVSALSITPSDLTYFQAAYALISSLWLTAPNIPLLHALKVIAIFAAAVAVAHRLRDSSELWFPDWFAGAVFAGGLLFIADSFFGYPMIDALFGPPIQYRINANIEALSLLLWPALLALSAKRRTLLAAALWIAMGFAVLRSPSQAAWLGFFAGSAALALTWRWSRVGVWFVTACAVVGIILAPALGWAADAILPYLPSWFAHEASASQRVSTWLIYAEKIRAAPFFGNGFRSNYPGYPTNFALQIWSELGAAGAFLAAVAMGLAGRATLDRDRVCRPYVVATGTAVYAQAYVTLGAWLLPALGIRLLPIVIAVHLCWMVDRTNRR